MRDKKLIVNIPKEDIRIFESASKIENRTRNNFIITHSKNKALEILFNRGLNGNLEVQDLEKYEIKSQLEEVKN